MAARQDMRRARGVNLPVTLQSIAGLAAETIQVRQSPGLPALELHVDGEPLLLLSEHGAIALAAALLEGLAALDVSATEVEP
jgi:hypothetical protein